jgi:hypothetical protein
MHEEGVGIASAIESELAADLVDPIPQIVYERDLIVLKRRLGDRGR